MRFVPGIKIKAYDCSSVDMLAGTRATCNVCRATGQYVALGAGLTSDDTTLQRPTGRTTHLFCSYQSLDCFAGLGRSDTSKLILHVAYFTLISEPRHKNDPLFA